MDDHKFWLYVGLLIILATIVGGAVDIGHKWVQSKNQQTIDPIAQRIMKIGECGMYSTDRARLIELALKGSTNETPILER